jgi:deoxyuridine 5'-triphosphate nucleotidohydrolase
MLTVKFKKLHADVKLPIKGSSHAACYDVYAHSVSNMNDGKIKVGLGFATEIPVGWKGIIVPRSNLTKYTWVMNHSFGVVDSDFRGEWMAIFTPIGYNVGFPYQVGDRVAQIFFDKVEEVELLEVDSLDSSDRGTGAFGSTGLN